MKLGRTICLVILGIFAIASLSYAYTAMVNLAPDTTGDGTGQKVGATINAEGVTPDKASPMHAWKAIVAAGYALSCS